ncbi:MAG: hypothetical protein WAU01_03870 [Saprospiraceae bacterium]
MKTRVTYVIILLISALQVRSMDVINGELMISQNMRQIYSSCNQLTIDKQNILWANIPNFGKVRTTLDDGFDVKFKGTRKSETFETQSPWYKRWYAYLLYLGMCAIGVYFVKRAYNIALNKEKKKLLYKEEEEEEALRQNDENARQVALLQEQKQLLTEFDDLKKQLKSKTIELANKAKENDAKNRLILLLKENFQEIQNNPSKANKKWFEINRILDSFMGEDDNTFEIQMDELHQEFFGKLNDRFEGLSIYDLRLCAYLKIGMNSKEIAEILNVLPSSAYISRSRLRKKLGLNIEDDLYSFLNNV